MPHKQIAAAGRSLLFFGGNRFCNASCGFIKRAPRPRRESGVNRTLLVTDMWFEKARAGDTDAAWLFARASLCGCALAAAGARALALSGRRPAFASPRTFPPSMATTAVQPCTAATAVQPCSHHLVQRQRCDQDYGGSKTVACGFPGVCRSNHADRARAGGPGQDG